MCRGIALLYMLVALGLAQTHACSCVGEEDVRHARKHADAVFAGKVINAEKLEVTSQVGEIPNFKEPVMRYTLLVERWFKGRISKDEVIVFTGMGGGDCGYEFELNKSFIV